MTTPEIIKPTVGRKVWFRNNGSMQKLPRADGGTAHPVFCGIEQPMDATVIFVHGARMVNLDITDHIGQRFVATSVPLLQDDDAIPDMGFYCEWMPYQKGQAAKVEAKEAAAVLNNPHTGTPRDPRDVASDPQAILCVKPGEPLKAAPITLPVVDPGPDSLEREIQAKANRAPRVTPADVKAEIVGETFTLLPSGRVTVCELTLKNGFTVRGESAVVFIENFDEGIGRKVARDNAEKEVWQLLGFRLRDEQADAAADLADVKLVPPHQQRVLDEKRELDERLSKLDAFILDNPLYLQLPTDEQDRLSRQSKAMAAYSGILDERIASF